MVVQEVVALLDELGETGGQLGCFRGDAGSDDQDGGGDDCQAGEIDEGGGDGAGPFGGKEFAGEFD